MASASAQTAKQWNIDKSHASVQFSIDHFFSSVPGKFKKFEGEINFDPNDLKGSKAVFTIDVRSVDTDEPERDGHLQSEDFFNAEKWPEMKFVSTRFEKKSDKEYIVHGKLTLRDVTKEVALPLTIKGRMDNPWKEGYEILGIKIDTSINRTDFGLGTGSWAATAVVSDEVEIEISMELDAKK
ncbi:MAG: polyisoprenoid-binding protein [Flavobacteriales bacterium]|nr:polyisoprenoid-binding protein [Flavobacteriales bacterium]